MLYISFRFCCTIGLPNKLGSSKCHCHGDRCTVRMAKRFNYLCMYVCMYVCSIHIYKYIYWWRHASNEWRSAKRDIPYEPNQIKSNQCSRGVCPCSHLLKSVPTMVGATTETMFALLPAGHRSETTKGAIRSTIVGIPLQCTVLRKV